MKKYLYRFLIALFAVVSFSFVSCSDDDNDSGVNSGQIEINGVTYDLSIVTLSGSWDETLQRGEFTVSVNNENNGVIIVEYYTFSFENSACPQTGNDVAQMNLALTPLNEEEEGNIIELLDSFKYSSGKAVVTDTNSSESEITIRFENLSMSNGERSYTFNGTATLMFEY